MKQSLEFFAGTGSFSKVMREKGYTTIETDIQLFENTNYVKNILDIPND
jgi:hypothetical protein